MWLGRRVHKPRSLTRKYLKRLSNERRRAIHRLNFRNKRLKLKTARNLPIGLEESMEYTSKNFHEEKRKDHKHAPGWELETLEFWRIVPKKSPRALGPFTQKTPTSKRCYECQLSHGRWRLPLFIVIKVHRYWMVTLFQLPNSLLGHETRDWYESVNKVHIEAVATFLIIFGVHMNGLFIVKGKILFLYEMII